MVECGRRKYLFIPNSLRTFTGDSSLNYVLLMTIGTTGKASDILPILASCVMDQLTDEFLNDLGWRHWDHGCLSIFPCVTMSSIGHNTTYSGMNILVTSEYVQRGAKARDIIFSYCEPIILQQSFLLYCTKFVVEFHTKNKCFPIIRFSNRNWYLCNLIWLPNRFWIENKFWNQLDSSFTAVFDGHIF